jgi:transcriptional regulator with XRE-family HTH domain
MSKLGDAIRQAMSDQAMTAYRLAKLTGLSRAAVQKIRDGADPRTGNAEKLADALGLTIRIYT